MSGSELTSPLAVPLYGFGRAEMKVISASVRSFRTFFYLRDSGEVRGTMRVVIRGGEGFGMENRPITRYGRNAVFLRRTHIQSLNLRANFRQYADILVTEKKKTVKRLEKKSELVYNK